MNDATLKLLKAVVEQAVQPVHATIAGKMRMREELLAHLISVFEDEFDRTGDERTAFNEAARRFGDPRTLTHQLQQSVPLANRCRSILENLCGRPHESAWRLAAKHCLVLLAIYSVVLLVFLSVLAGKGLDDARIIRGFIAAEGRLRFVTTFVDVLVVITLLNATLSLISAWLFHKFGRPLADKRWGRYLLAVLCVLMSPLLLSAFGGAAAIFILMALQVYREQRCRVEWAS
jgi:hypothetical protein